MSPFLSPSKPDANSGIMQGLKLFSTEKMPSEIELKDNVTQVVVAEQPRQLPENEPLGNNFKQQKTVMIERNPTII